MRHERSVLRGVGIGGVMLAAAFAGVQGAAGPAGAGEPAQSAPATMLGLNVRKSILEKQKATLEARQRDIETRVMQSDALAPLRKALQAAKDEYDQKKRSSASFGAREKELTAKRDLDELVSARAVSGGQTAKIEEQRKAVNAEWCTNKFQTVLLGLKLRYETQKAQPDVDDDSEVKRLAEAVRAAEQDLRANPSEAVVAAREPLRKASAALAPMEQRLKDNSTLQAMAAAERATRQAIRDAEQKDIRRETVDKARKVYQDARQEALAKIPDAKPFLSEVETADKAKKEVDMKRRGIRRVFDAHREAARAGSAPEVVAAREAVTAAKAAYDKVIASTNVLSALKEKADAAGKALEQKQEELFGKNAEYQEFSAKIKEKEKKASELEAGAVKTSSGDSLAEAASEIETVRGEIGGLSSRQSDIRAGTAKEILDNLQTARSAAERDLRDKAWSTPEAADALRNLNAAEEKLKAAVEKSAAEGKEWAVAAKKLRELDRASLDLECRIAVAKQYLESDLHPILPAVETDPVVVQRREAMRVVEVRVQENPIQGLNLLRDMHAEAKRKYEDELDKVRERGYEDAVAVRDNAATEVRNAEREDPKRKVVEEARAAWQQKRNAVLAEIKEVKKAQEEHQKAQAELQKVQDRRKALVTQSADSNKTIRDSSDPDIVAARQKLEDARKAMKESENSEDAIAAGKKVEDAKRELEAKAREAALADKDYKAAAKETADIDAKLAAIAKQMREAQDASRSSAPPRDEK